MTKTLSIAALALAIGAVSADAQVRTTERVRDVILGDRRADSRTTNGGIGDIIFGRTDSRADTRTNSRVPKGHLPPRGKCRVWVDGVPPGHQPPVTSCADAERERAMYGANARVIYGSDQAFPGKGKGKYKKQDRSRTDIFGRVIEDDDDRFQDRRGRIGKGRKG